MKPRLNDMIILLPGITGSVLQKDGKDLWALSGQAAWQALSSLGGSLQALQLSGDDPGLDDLEDGICATRLMPDAHLVPGLVKIDGYSSISRLITGHFEVKAGHIENPEPANFFEFPYDWRRDNRVAARQLQRLIAQRLSQWRDYCGYQNAKVILLAHSMGGLVARYYLEVLEGWRNCRALITFGTPYRGSVDALNYLANGYKELFIDLTEVMRSFTSIYQLLPIYKMIKVGQEYQRVAETEAIPQVEKARAEQALAFHRDIEAAVKRHWGHAAYRDQYKTIPIVGTRQPTLQSAELTEGRLTVSRAIPAWIDSLLQDGDSTVPRLSAIPIELSHEYRDTFFAERHSSLQANDQVLNALYERIKQMQVRGLSVIRGPSISPDKAEKAAISLELDDVYRTDEPVEIKAQLINSREDPGKLIARIEPVGMAVTPIEGNFQETEAGWVLFLELTPWLYRLEVRTHQAGPLAPSSVHDIFEVIP